MQNGKAAEIVLCSVFHGTSGGRFLNLNASDVKRLISRQQQEPQRSAAAAKVAHARAMLYTGKIRQRHRICAERKLRGRNLHPVFPTNQLFHPRLPKTFLLSYNAKRKSTTPKSKPTKASQSFAPAVSL